MADRYVEFYGTLPNGVAGPAVVYGFPSGGTVQVGNTGDTANAYVHTIPLATGTYALLQFSQAWTGTQDFTGGSILVPTMPFGNSSTSAASTEFVMAGLNAIATVHSMCHVASQVDVTIATPGALIDGYAPALNDRILLVGQSTGSQNGPWVWNGAAVPLTRPIDWISGATDLASFGVGFDVLHGNTNAGTFWYVSTTGAITIDTTSVAFTVFPWNMSNGFVQGILPVAHGGTGLATIPTGYIPYGNGTGVLQTSANLTYSGTELVLGALLRFMPVAAGVNNGDTWTDSTQQALFTRQNSLNGALPQVIFTSTASATVANTVTATSVIGTGVGTKTLPANWAVVGKQLVIDFDGIVSNTGSPTINIDVRLGSTVIATSGAITTPSNVTNTKVSGRVLLTFRTIGATGTVIGGGVAIIDKAGTATTVQITATGTTTIDTTVSQVADVFVTWGTASASNTITGQQARYTTGM